MTQANQPSERTIEVLASQLFEQLVFETESGSPDAALMADIGMRAIGLEHASEDKDTLRILNAIWQEANYALECIESNMPCHDPALPFRLIRTEPKQELF